ncbi:dehydrogenase [Burkholderia sp. THE68]|uniref:NAD(P)-dependent oxidoreductase n=1 Tax=Burkholderia sp. THE68 TaxID=758782 RepID=UPI0013198911|nr:NAD(P)-dependent oxidoreductase [Burkholderia sp. THE68]BBU30323.1 dehydrogenase [Burkholderia sp. THE68]
MAKVAFLGLGAMGFPMAGYLASKGGHEVTVFNRTASKSADWVKKYGGHSAESPTAAAQGKDFVFSCVGNDDDLRSVTMGKDGAFQAMKAGTVYVDHTTASAKVARELNDAARSHGIGFVDAPVSGGRLGAERGTLTIMCGGSEEHYGLVKPILESSYARAITLLGPNGSGQLTKMVNQICLVGLIEGLSEGLHFAQKSGLNIENVIEAISKGSAQSWQMENHWKPMSEGRFDFGFAVEWMRKDLSICLDEARRNGASLPGTALIDNFFSEIERMGGARWDTSSLLARLNR